MQRFRREPALVRRACGCLAALADDIEGGEALDLGAACDLLHFFELFVDEGHQRKEEEVLFRALLRTGRMSGRVGELLAEHGSERCGLGRMRAALTEVAAGAHRGEVRFAEIAEGYTRAQLEHADKEDEVLLPLAEELLDERRRRTSTCAALRSTRSSRSELAASSCAPSRPSRGATAPADAR
ncbi:MAG: hemerythrin domain-containing protein, partial [Planctomycetota bacterium]